MSKEIKGTKEIFISASLIVLVISSSLLSSCQQGGDYPVSAAIYTETPSDEAAYPTITTLPSLTSSPTVETLSTQKSDPPAETPTPTPEEKSPTVTQSLTPVVVQTGCQEKKGKFEIQEINSDLVDYTVYFRIYLPPCYDPHSKQSYPVLYMLHGQSSTDDQWERIGIGDAADRLISAGEAPPFIIVLPREIYYLENAQTSTFDTEVLNVIMPWVEKNYVVCTERTCRAIGGMSRGAGWAIRIGFQNMDKFGSIGAHSATPFTGDYMDLYYYVKDVPLDQRPRFYMDIGWDDLYFDQAANLEDKCVKYKVEHEWHVYQGTHSEEYWRAHVEEYLRWYTFPWKTSK